MLKKIILAVVRKLYRIVLLRFYFPAVYRSAAKKPIDEDKVIFLSYGGNSLPPSFVLIEKFLAETTDFKITLHLLKKEASGYFSYLKRCTAMIRDIADCRYIFASTASNILSRITLRSESVYMQTWHACGAFKKFGFGTAELIFGGDEEELTAYPNHKNDTYVSVSSPEVVKIYEEAMGVGKTSKAKVLPIGVSRTDIFFDESQIEAAREFIFRLVPQAEGKKILLYAPTYRGRASQAAAPDALDPSLLKKHLGDEYVLIIKHHSMAKNRPLIPKEAADFAFDLSGKAGIEPLLMVSDICISDYSSLVFEYSLFERPMIFFAYDIDEYNDWRGFYYPYETFTPGDTVKTNEELIESIKNADNFSRERVREFRDKFMSSCDGHSTERIIELVFGERLSGHLINKND